MRKDDLVTRVNQAVASNDSSAIWAAYKDAWLADIAVPMSGEVFGDLFRDVTVATEAQKLVLTSDTAQAMLAHTARTASIAIGDVDVRRLFIVALGGVDDALDEWEALRTLRSPDRKVDLAAGFTCLVLEDYGRQEGRARLAAACMALQSALLEEEIDRIILRLDSERALTGPFLRQLGHASEERGRLLLARGDIRPYETSSRFPSIPAITGSAPSDVRARVGALLHLVHLTTDVRDARLKTDEYNRINASSGMPPWWSEKDMMRFIRHHGHFEDLAVIAAPQRVSNGDTVAFSFPLLRLLHMRLLLDTPSLSDSLAHPERSLVPEWMLHLLGREGVSYVPELRLARDSDRRWAARYVELSGEAVAVMFAEDVLRLELASLWRVPEDNREQRPDFGARTLDGERIVMETKGSRKWKKHLRQRQEALLQLRKKGSGSNAACWTENARAFGCSLFAAEEGDKRSSLFHVQDPCFAFEHLFHEGWDEHARRRHYAGVLEACEDFALAEHLLRRNSNIEREESPLESFFLDSRETEDAGDHRHNRFLVKRVLMDEWAHRLGHPRPQAFRDIRVCVGVAEDIYRMLERGRVPHPLEIKNSLRSDDNEGSVPRISDVGLLSSEGGGARGVYSILSDGACLAVELG